MTAAKNKGDPPEKVMENKTNKPYKELDLSNDFLFGKIMQTNPEVCKQLLEMILGRKITKIGVPDFTEDPEVQKTIRITDDGKGIRLDVYLEGDDTVYDIEMQTTLNNDLSKRTRYYQGMIDLNLIEKGAAYSQLRKSYIIFICLQDPFGRGRCMYTFENMCLECPGLILQDGSTKIFLNASADKAGVPKELAAFLDYLSGQPASDPFTKNLDELVNKAREHDEWEVEFMTLLQIKQQEREEGRAEGVDRMAALTATLLFNGLIKDLELPTKDPQYREELFQKYNI